MAGVLASYLISNGATDTRLSGGEKKGAKEGRRKGPRKPSRRRGRPSSSTASAAGFIRAGAAAGSRPGFIGRVAAVAIAGDDRGRQATTEAKQKLTKRKPGEEGAKETPAPGETAKLEGGKPDGSKPSEAPSQSANAAPSAPGRDVSAAARSGASGHAGSG